MAVAPKRDIRPGLSAGLGIPVGLIAAKTAEKALAPSRGDWGAFGLSLVVGVVAAVIVAAIINAVVKPPA